MKINYLKSLLALTASLFITYTTSCSNDDDNFENKKETALLSVIENERIRWEYEYDNKNRLIKNSRIYLNTDTTVTEYANLNYDNQGRLSEVILGISDKNIIKEKIYSYTYSKDTIFNRKFDTNEIDTLIVKNNQLVQMNTKYDTNKYVYDAYGNLIEVSIFNYSFKYIHKTSYKYDNLKHGLFVDTAVPSWFNASNDYFSSDLSFSKNLCVEIFDQIYIIEDEIEINMGEYDNRIFDYIFEDQLPYKMNIYSSYENSNLQYRFSYIKK